MSKPSKASSKPSSPLIQQLLAKKRALEEQLDAVCKVLESEGYVTAPRHKWEATSPLTKAQAIERTLSKAKRPLGVSDLIAGMESEGYVFNTSNKKNALNNLLYGHKLPWLVRGPEGFSITR